MIPGIESIIKKRIIDEIKKELYLPDSVIIEFESLRNKNRMSTDTLTLFTPGHRRITTFVKFDMFDVEHLGQNETQALTKSLLKYKDTVVEQLRIEMAKMYAELVPTKKSVSEYLKKRKELV